VPALEAALSRFQAAHTQVLGVSVDSVFSHANWAKSLGGVSFPLLSDFQPRGAVAHSVGAFIEPAGITDRATVLIDSDGVVQYSKSVSPAGVRDIEELATLCEEHDSKSEAATSDFVGTDGVPVGTRLFVKSDCGFSRSVLLTVENLHLGDSVEVRNVSEDDAARSDFEGLSGKTTAPCLSIGGELMFESADITQKLVALASEL
jgi:glutaredoxin-related protein